VCKSLENIVSMCGWILAKFILGNVPSIYLFLWVPPVPKNKKFRPARCRGMVKSDKITFQWLHLWSILINFFFRKSSVYHVHLSNFKLNYFYLHTNSYWTLRHRSYFLVECATSFSARCTLCTSVGEYEFFPNMDFSIKRRW
jgi:hypothetical protein